MIRASSLPVVQYCAASAQFSGASSRASAMSSAFHSRMAGSPDADQRLALLSDGERDEVLSWLKPATVVLEWDGAALEYAEAEKELAVGLDSWGCYAPAGTEDNLVDGHLDMAWHEPSTNIVFVGDIKKTVWTTADGPESLQLHAYGWAYAMKVGALGYVTGLWLATEGEWQWAKEPVLFGSERADRIWARLYHAATQVEGEFSMGNHCKACYGRTKCPAYALPAAALDTWLAPVVADGLTAEQYAEFLAKVQAAEEVIERAKKNLQERVRHGDIKVRDPKTGKIWAPVETKGRESCSVANLRAKLGPAAEDYISRGASFSQFRWVKEA